MVCHMKKQTKETVPVWDIAVRAFHWGLVAAFTIAYLTEDDFETLHVYAGYIVLGLISFRMIWGLIGTKHARFSDFVCRVSTVKQYLKTVLTGKPKHYLGHNPAGGMMIVVLLLSLFALSYSGLATYAAEGKGPLANTETSLIPSAYADDDHHHSGKGDLWEDIHELLANFTLLLVFIHVAGVFVSSLMHRENLIRAMVTGKKQSQPE
jgi:cytochrome b